MGVDDDDCRYALKYRLSTEPPLLVLDNFEHLLAAKSEVLNLLRASPQLKVLITSRSALRVAGEHEFSVSPLATPDDIDGLEPDVLASVPSVGLLCDRGRHSGIDFQLTSENAVAVAEICRRLDGLPLALELAAARLKLFTPETLLSRLERRLPLLVAGPQDRPPHQQTVHDTIDWSYKLLTAAEQRLFGHLAVLASGWDVAAAEAIDMATAARKPDTLVSLTALLDHSLVIRRIGPDREVRFGMLQTIQEFALDQLQVEGQVTQVQRAHALHFASVAEDMEVRSVGTGRQLQLARFRADHANFQAALRWCLDAGELTIASRIVGSLWNSWACGYVAEGRRWADLLLASQDAAEPTRARAKVLTTAGIMAILQDDGQGARMYLCEAIPIWRALPDQHFELALALTHLGRSLAGEDVEHAEELADEALAIFESLGNSHWRSMALRHRGMIAEAAGNTAAVQSLYSQSLAVARESGDPRGLAQILCHVGRLALREGDGHSARLALEESLDLLRRIGDRRYTAVVLESLARLARLDHNSGQARRLFAEALDLFRETGDKPGIAACLVGLDSCPQLSVATHDATDGE
jgi:predicted ATPase